MTDWGAALAAMKADWDATDLPPIKCGSCRACCLGDTVKLQPGEDPTRYKTKLIDGRHQLRKGKDGNCVYLGKAGCRIQDRKPLACRLYDCRVDYRNSVKRGATARLDLPPLQRGRELLGA
jgi:Fe-S-cluster containining protein